MRLIQANCRVQFTAADIAFILSVLKPTVSSEECLIELLADEETRDLILDDEALLRAVLEQTHCIRVSTHFYFYILVRQVLRRADINERGVADYVAELLSEFSREENTRCVIRGQELPLNYFFEMLAALQTADDQTAFEIRAHIGNSSLFMSGVFPGRLRWRTERRGAPNLGYYEELGRSSFRAARDHQLARRYQLDRIFDVLSERFDVTRRALNDLSERLVFTGEKDTTPILPESD